MKNSNDLRSAVISRVLRSCNLFAGLPAADLETVATFAVIKTLAKGDYLFHEGDSADGLYVVQRGLINVHRVSAAGKEQVIHVFRPGESFAEATLVSQGGYPADATAIEPSSVILIPKKDFVALLRTRPDLSLRMLASMSQHLRVLVGLLDDLRLKDVETRLANWLLQRCPRPLSEELARIDIGMPKRVLAAQMGTTSETLSRTLAKFRDQNLILVKGQSIQVTNPIALQQCLERHPGVSDILKTG